MGQWVWRARQAPQAARAGGNWSVLGLRQQVCDREAQGPSGSRGRPQAPRHPPHPGGPTRAMPWGARLGQLPALTLSLPPAQPPAVCGGLSREQGAEKHRRACVSSSAKSHLCCLNSAPLPSGEPFVCLSGNNSWLECSHEATGVPTVCVSVRGLNMRVLFQEHQHLACLGQGGCGGHWQFWKCE